MGYESKIIIIRKTTVQSTTTYKDMYFGIVLAMFNLRVKRGIAEEFRKLNKYTSHYFYLEDGNKEIVEDRYGQRLYSMDIFTFRSVLEKHGDTSRLGIALQAFIHQLTYPRLDDNYTDDIEVLHYGY